MKENANRLHFKCTDFNSSKCVSVYDECIYMSTEYLRNFEHLQYNVGGSKIVCLSAAVHGTSLNKCYK